MSWPACARCPSRPYLVLEHSPYAFARELRAPVQSDQLNQHRDGVDVSAELADEIDGCARGASGGEQVVDDQDLLSLLDRVAVHFETVGPVFQIVADADLRGRELADLAYGDEARADAIGDRR